MSGAVVAMSAPAQPKPKRTFETPRAGACDLIEGADAIARELGMITADTPRGTVIKARKRVYHMVERGGWPIWRDAGTGTICSSRQALKDHIDAQARAAIARGATS